MEKRKWEAPRTMALADLAEALGDCIDGSTATQMYSDCDQGDTPLFWYADCLTGGQASASCSTGQMQG
jgi:hypothetical protein